MTASSAPGPATPARPSHVAIVQHFDGGRVRLVYACGSRSPLIREAAMLPTLLAHNRAVHS
jgi:hypothetical protein